MEDNQVQDIQTGEDPREKLYNVVKERGLYTKSFDEFKSKYNDLESLDKLYGVVSSEGLYTKSKDEFIKKYGPTSNEIKLSLKPNMSGMVPKMNPETESQMQRWGKESIEKAYADPAFEKKKKSFAENKVKGAEVIQRELQSNDDVIANDIKQMKFQNAGQAATDVLMTQNRSDNPMAKNIPIPEQSTLSLQAATPDEMIKYKEEVQNNPVAQRAVLKKISELKPEKRGEIESSLYRIDAATRYGNDNDLRINKAEDNAEKIRKGELIYDPMTQTLIKPEGFLGSLKLGLDQRNELLRENEYLSNASDEDAIKYFESKQKNIDPDEPIKIPKGKLAEIANMTGGESVKIGTGAILNAAPIGRVANFILPVGIGAREDYNKTFPASFEQAYFELKQQGVAPGEAIKIARKQATDEAELSAAEGIVSTAVGLRIGGRILKAVNPSATKSLLSNVIKQGGESLKDIAFDAGVAGAMQYRKNVLAQQKGIERDLNDQVLENIEGEFVFGLGLGAVTGAVHVTKKVANSTLFNMAKMPKSQTDTYVDNMAANGMITPEQAAEAKKKLDEQRILNAQIPSDIKEESALKIQDKIKQRDELEKKMEGLDKAYHPEIKEQIKSINEEIVNLSNDKIEIPKEQKPLKRELEKAINDGTLKGAVADMAKFAIQSEGGVEEFFKDVADQALNKIGDQTSDEVNMQRAKEVFGEEIVNKAVEMFPKEKKSSYEYDSNVLDNEYNEFIDTGKVSEYRLNDIANKVKNQEKLSDREMEIFSDKTSEINKIISQTTKIETEQDFEAELKKLFDETTDKLVSENNKQASESTAEDYLKKGKAVLDQLFPGVQITAYETSKEYETKEGRPKGSVGMFDPQANRIALNMEAIKNKGVENTIFHEVIHPIVNAAASKNENAVSELFDQLEGMKDEKGMEAVWEHMNAYASRGGKIQKVEAVTEFLSLVADGKIDTKSLSERTISKIIDWVNKAFEVLGINKRISTANDLKRLSDSVTEALQKGDTSKLKKTLGENSSQNLSETMDALKDFPDEEDFKKRGAEWAIKKINTALKNGILSEEAAKLGKDLINRNPKLFEDLAIRILNRKPGNLEGQIAGYYNQEKAEATLFKNSGEHTLIHEILHHTERFLPEESRKAIINEWAYYVKERLSQLQKDKSSDRNNSEIKYLKYALERQSADSKNKARIRAEMNRIYNSDLDYSSYMYSTPSEWWAVNASRIFKEQQNAPKTWVRKAIDFINNAISPLMTALFGKQKFQDVENALKLITEGKTLNIGVDNVLSNEQTTFDMSDSKKERLKDMIKRADGLPTDRLAQIISNTAKISVEDATSIINSVRKPRVRVQVGKPENENTNPETKKQNTESNAEFQNKPKSILNAIYNSDKISESTKKKFEEHGLTYRPQSQEEARKTAKEIIDWFGVENSIAMAESGRFDGDVNSMIFAEGIDRTFLEEKEAKTVEEKNKLAEKWADYAIRYDEAARSKGRFISAIQDFYRKSPLGVILAEKKKRQQAFDEWYEKRNKPFKEVFEAIKSMPEFKELIERGTPAKTEDIKEVRAKRRQKISSFFDKLKIGNKGANSSIVPAPIWDAAVEVMKQAFLAGESIANVIEKGISHINKNHNEAWDIDNFKEQWGEKLSELQAEQEEIKKEIQQKILDKFRKKLSGLTDEQKTDVIRKSFRKLVENGALNYDDFKKIIANTLGFGDLSAEQVTNITNMVNDINAVQDAADNVMKQKTDEDIREAIKNFDKISKKAAESATKLAGTLYNKPDIGQRVRSIIQLNTLGFVSLLKNPFYNIFHQSLVRFPKSLLLTLMDQTIYGASLLGNKLFGNPIIKPDVNIFLAQHGYWTKASEGGSESVKQVFTGLTNKDYFQKEIYNAQIKPMQSWRDIWAWMKGDKQFSGKQIIDKALQGTVGVPAEIVARGLNIGDKGFRYAAEGAIAETLGKQEFGLKGVQLERFVKFPKETAEKLYRDKGLSFEEASKKAEDIEKRIINEGEEAVFQQENWISEKLKRLKQVSANEDSSVVVKAGEQIAKMIGVLNMPFVKTPINVGWEILNLVVPELALIQSAAYGLNAARTKSGVDVLRAKKWMAHAAVGYALMSATAYLASLGAISGDDEDEDYKAKEAKGKATYEQPRRLNISKLQRLFSGGSTATEDGDVMVDLSWFGGPGMIMNMQANRYENMTKEEREQMSYVSDLAYRMKNGAAEGLTNSVFQGAFSAIDAIRSGNPNVVGQWLNNMMNVGMNFFEPATIAQLSRASRDYDYEIKAEDITGKMINSLKSRFFLDVNPKINIWGEPMKREGGPADVALRMLGISKFNKDRFGIPIFEDFKRTGNADFFPSDVKGEFSVKGEKIKLSIDEERQFKTLVGQSRAALVGPYINGMATIKLGSDEKKYQDLDGETKIKFLKALYKSGYENGKAQFLILNPKFYGSKTDE